MPLRRAFLYVPGDQERKIRKATTLDADSVCLDLEDGVAPDAKDTAREQVARLLRELDFGSAERLVRINALTTPWAFQDLDAVLPSRPDGIVVPKVEAPWQLHQVAYRIQMAEESMGLPLGSIRLLAILETARGVLNAATIAQATSRLDALIFGAEDFAASMGAVRTPEHHEVAYARGHIVVVAKAHNLQAIDMVYVRYTDVEGLEKEARQGAQMGFDGKQVIHPAQIPVVKKAFTPEPQVLDFARRVVDAFEAGLREGKGVVVVDGKMIDAPLYKAAKNVLARAGLE